MTQRKRAQRKPPKPLTDRAKKQWMDTFNKLVTSYLQKSDYSLLTVDGLNKFLKYVKEELGDKT